MVSELREFNSLDELAKYIESKVDELRKKLADLLRIIEEVRIRAESEKKIRDLLTKLTSARVEAATVSVELKVARVVINPPATAELSALEQLAESINSKLTALQTLRKELEPLLTAALAAKVIAVVIDDVPRQIVLKL